MASDGSPIAFAAMEDVARRVDHAGERARRASMVPGAVLSVVGLLIVVASYLSPLGRLRALEPVEFVAGVSIGASLLVVAAVVMSASVVRARRNAELAAADQLAILRGTKADGS